MAKILVVYYSGSGNTEKMAKLVGDGVKKAEVDVKIKEVTQAKVDELLEVDGLIIGSPTYYGSMAAPIKEFFDASVKYHGKLDGKVGGAFTSSANLAGGNETTILDMINAMLIHGMIVQGDAEGDHYGAVAIGAPNKRSQARCRRLGKRVANLARRFAQ